MRTLCMDKQSFALLHFDLYIDWHVQLLISLIDTLYLWMNILKSKYHISQIKKSNKQNFADFFFFFKFQKGLQVKKKGSS